MFTLSMLGNFYSDTHQYVKYFAGPDLGPNILQKLSAEATSHKELRQAIWYYSKTCLKQPLKNRQNNGLNGKW